MIGSDLFFFVVKLNIPDCFCTNQTYLILSALIMAGLEPEKRVFLIKNYYQRGESVEFARKAFNTKYGNDSAPHRDTVKR
jgi:hypothetical protein